MDKQQYTEKLVGLYTSSGLTPSASQVLVYLSLCTPARQHAVTIQQQTGLSAGSVSAGLSLLVDAFLVQRLKIPGDRHFYYEIENETWHKAVEVQISAIHTLLEVTKQGLELYPDNDRLKSMLATYSFFSKEFEGAAERYKKHIDS